MADLPISDFPSLTGANVAVDNDTIPIVDASAVETKRISVNELFVSGIANALSFTQSGVGAVPRTAQEKAREHYSAADNTTIQQGLDYLVVQTNGELEVPAGTYATSAGLTLAPSSGSISVNVRGVSGALGSVINYTGAAGTALLVKNNGRYKISNLEIEDGGTGANGLALQSLAAGSSHGPGLIENVRVTGFTNNFHIGTAADLAAAELNFILVEAASGTNGILVEGINSIGLRFAGFNATNNTNAFRYSCDTTRNDNVVSFKGGSLTGHAVDWKLDSPLNLTVDDVYSEGSGAWKFIETAAGDVSAIPMFCHFKNVHPKQSGAVASVIAWPGTYIFENCRHDAAITVGDAANFNRYDLFFIGGGSLPAINYAGGSHSIVRVRRTGGMSVSNNQTTSDDVDYVLLDGGTRIDLEKTPWSGHPTVSIPGLVKHFPRGAHIGASGVVRLMDDFLGDVIADEWNSRIGSGPGATAAAILANQHRGVMRLVTGADAAGTMATNGVQLESGLNWVASLGELACEFRVTFSATSNIVIYVGLTDQNSALEMPIESAASGDNITTNASNAVGVMFDTAMSADNWWLVGVANDADATPQNSGVAPVAGTMETWRIEVSSDGNATFYRNGTTIGSTMTGSVGASIQLTPVIAAFTRDNSNRNVDGDYVLVQANR